MASAAIEMCWHGLNSPGRVELKVQCDLQTTEVDGTERQRSECNITRECDFTWFEFDTSPH